MTVYSHAALLQNVRPVRRQSSVSKKAVSTLSNAPKLRKLNMGILLAVVVLGGAYIILANTTVSQSFALKQKRTALNQLSAQVAAAELGIGGDVDVAKLTEVAQRNGMVSEKQTAVMYTASDVALNEAAQKEN